MTVTESLPGWYGRTFAPTVVCPNATYTNAQIAQSAVVGRDRFSSVFQQQISQQGQASYCVDLTQRASFSKPSVGNVAPLTEEQKKSIQGKIELFVPFALNETTIWKQHYRDQVLNKDLVARSIEVLYERYGTGFVDFLRESSRQFCQDQVAFDWALVLLERAQPGYLQNWFGIQNLCVGHVPQASATTIQEKSSSSSSSYTPNLARSSQEELRKRALSVLNQNVQSVLSTSQNDQSVLAIQNKSLFGREGKISRFVSLALKMAEEWIKKNNVKNEEDIAISNDEIGALEQKYGAQFLTEVRTHDHVRKLSTIDQCKFDRALIIFEDETPGLLASIFQKNVSEANLSMVTPCTVGTQESKSSSSSSSNTPNLARCSQKEVRSVRSLLNQNAQSVPVSERFRIFLDASIAGKPPKEVFNAAVIGCILFVLQLAKGAASQPLNVDEVQKDLSILLDLFEEEKATLQSLFAYIRKQADSWRAELQRQPYLSLGELTVHDFESFLFDKGLLLLGKKGIRVLLEILQKKSKDELMRVVAVETVLLNQEILRDQEPCLGFGQNVLLQQRNSQENDYASLTVKETMPSNQRILRDNIAFLQSAQFIMNDIARNVISRSQEERAYIWQCIENVHEEDHDKNKKLSGSVLYLWGREIQPKVSKFVKEFLPLCPPQLARDLFEQLKSLILFSKKENSSVTVLGDRE